MLAPDNVMIFRHGATQRDQESTFSVTKLSFNERVGNMNSTRMVFALNGDIQAKTSKWLSNRR